MLLIFENVGTLTSVPWLEYLYTIGEFLALKLIITEPSIQNTPTDINTK